MGVKSPPPRKPAVGFLQTQEVMNCGFLCLIRKSELSKHLGCAVPFWGVSLAEVGARAARSHQQRFLWRRDVPGRSVARSDPA